MTKQVKCRDCGKEAILQIPDGLVYGVEVFNYIIRHFGWGHLYGEGNDIWVCPEDWEQYPVAS